MTEKERASLDGFPLLDNFSIPDAGVCGAFASEVGSEKKADRYWHNEPNWEDTKDFDERSTTESIAQGYLRNGKAKDWDEAMEMAARFLEKDANRRFTVKAQWGTAPDLPAPEVGWGRPYGGDKPSFLMADGQPVWMFRNGQRVRFYDQNGQQVGQEQSNVAPAMAYAMSQGWQEVSEKPMRVPGYDEYLDKQSIRKNATHQDFENAARKFQDKVSAISMRHDWNIDEILDVAYGMCEASGATQMANLLANDPNRANEEKFVNEGRALAQGLSAPEAVLFAFLIMEDVNLHTEGAPLWDWAREQFGVTEAALRKESVIQRDDAFDNAVKEVIRLLPEYEGEFDALGMAAKAVSEKTGIPSGDLEYVAIIEMGGGLASEAANEYKEEYGGYAKGDAVFFWCEECGQNLGGFVVNPAGKGYDIETDEPDGQYRIYNVAESDIVKMAQHNDYTDTPSPAPGAGGIDIAQTDDPKRQVGQENMEQQELTVPTTDKLSPSFAAGEGEDIEEKIENHVMTEGWMQDGKYCAIWNWNTYCADTEDELIDKIRAVEGFGPMQGPTVGMKRYAIQEGISAYCPQCDYQGASDGFATACPECGAEMILEKDTRKPSGFVDSAASYKDEQYGGQGLPKYVKDTKTGRVFGVIVYENGDVALAQEPDGPPWLFASVGEMQGYIAKGDFEPQEQGGGKVAAYVDPNFKSKKELRQAVERGEMVTVYTPGGIFPDPTDGTVTIEGPHYPEPHRWYATVQVENGRVVKVSNAGGGLESNDVVAPDGKPMRAEDEKGGQSMKNDDMNVASLKAAFPALSELSAREKMAIKLAVMTDSDIAETPTDVLIDALDTIDNRRSGAEPTQEQTGYRAKILEELKNRGVEYKKASYWGGVEDAYQAFMQTSKTQEDFDVVTREYGLGGQQIRELADHLTEQGIKVEARRRPFRKAAGGIHIGDIAVVPAGQESPYGSSLMGDERVNALQRWANREDVSEYDFWYAPSMGGARKDVSPDEVNWETSRIKSKGAVRTASEMDDSPARWLMEAKKTWQNILQDESGWEKVRPLLLEAADRAGNDSPQGKEINDAIDKIDLVWWSEGDTVDIDKVLDALTGKYAARKTAAAGPGRIAREFLEGRAPATMDNWEQLNALITYAPAMDVMNMDLYHNLYVAVNAKDVDGVRAAFEAISAAYPGDESVEDLDIEGKIGARRLLRAARRGTIPVDPISLFE